MLNDGDDKPLTPVEAQRGLLEVAVRMRMIAPGWKEYTHLRCNIRGLTEEWVLLDADKDGVRKEKNVNMGPTANGVAEMAASPITAGLNYSLARLTITFDPPKLSIDVLTDGNDVLASEYIIDHEVEERVRQELLNKLRRD